MIGLAGFMAGPRPQNFDDMLAEDRAERYDGNDRK